MPLSNEEILTRLDATMKNIVTPGDLGASVLQPEKFDRFVRQMQHRTVILDEARFKRMNAKKVDIDRIGFVGRILKAGTDGSGKHRELKDPDNDYAKPEFYTNQLEAQEVQAVAGLRDNTLRENIERGNLEETLIDLFGEAAGRDLEEYAILANSSIAWKDDDVLSLTDGWVKQAKQKLYGSGDGADFDPDDEDNFPVNLFNQMLQAIPKQYLQDPREYRIWTDWETFDAYRDYLLKRQTNLGDRAITEDLSLPFKGVEVRYCPMIERSKNRDAAKNFWGRVALMGHPDNMVWGVFHEVTVEKDRIPRDRRTDFVLTVEADSGYEDENASVAAFYDMEKPSES